MYKVRLVIDIMNRKGYGNFFQNGSNKDSISRYGCAYDKSLKVITV